MRQLLMLGFYCEVYRREPLCRIYINDVLVDEFNIAHTARKDIEWTDDMKLDPMYRSSEYYKIKSNTPFLKYIEFDDAGVRSLDIRVEIQNNDNNHANGFMSRYTRVMLDQCWLASVKIWEKFDEIWDRWKYSKYNWHRCVSLSRSVRDYYTGQRSYALDNLASYATMHFPDIVRRFQSTEQHKLSHSDYQDSLKFVCTNSDWVGSSGYFYLTLVKKLGFWRHSMDHKIGWWWCASLRNVKTLYNKYRDNEDKRNINK